jgi:hypothetical protein
METYQTETEERRTSQLKMNSEENLVPVSRNPKSQRGKVLARSPRMKHKLNP